MSVAPINTHQRRTDAETENRYPIPEPIHPSLHSELIFSVFISPVYWILDTAVVLVPKFKFQISSPGCCWLLAGWLLACWLYWLADRVGQTCLHSLSTRSSTRACLLYILQQQSYNNSTAGINHGQRSIPVVHIRTYC